MKTSHLLHILIASSLVAFSAHVTAGCLDLQTNAEIARCAEALRRGESNSKPKPDVRSGVPSYQYAAPPSTAPQPAYQSSVASSPASAEPTRAASFEGNPMLPSFIGACAVGIFLSWLIAPPKTSKRHSRWARYLAAFMVFTVTMSVLWRAFYYPWPAEGLNAFVGWALGTPLAAGVAYAFGYVLSRVVGMAPVAGSAVAAGRDHILQLKEGLRSRNKACPHCAEVIKREALVCRYCQRDVA